jgi:hypothetical protein
MINACNVLVWKGRKTFRKLTSREKDDIKMDAKKRNFDLNMWVAFV